MIDWVGPTWTTLNSTLADNGILKQNLWCELQSIAQRFLRGVRSHGISFAWHRATKVIHLRCWQWTVVTIGPWVLPFLFEPNWTFQISLAATNTLQYFFYMRDQPLTVSLGQHLPFDSTGSICIEELQLMKGRDASFENWTRFSWICSNPVQYLLKAGV
jgi:hypothetical protein